MRNASPAEPGPLEGISLLQRGRTLLLWAIVTGAAVRAFLIEFALPDIALEANGVYFLEMARSLREYGDPFAQGFHANRFDRGPLAAYVIGTLASLLDIVRAGRYTSALAGCALVPVVYFIARRLVVEDARVAGLAALATAWFPLLIEYSVLSYDDMLACLLFNAVVALLLGAVTETEPRRRLRSALLLGITTALGYLARPSGLSVLLVVIAVWGMLALAEHAGWKAWIVPSAITLVAFGVVAAPYVYYLSTLMGRFTLTAKSMVNLIWVTEGADRNYELAGDELVWVAATRDTTPLEYIVAHWHQFLFAAAKGVQWMITDHIAHALSLPIAVLAFHGFVTGKWDKQRVKLYLPVTLCLVSLVVPLSVFGTLTVSFGRYLIPIIPLSLVWFAKGLLDLTDRAPGQREQVTGRNWASWVQAGALALLAGYLVLGTVVGPGLKFWKLDRTQLQSAKAAGDWLKQNTPARAVICTSDSNLAFAAERTSVPEPFLTAEGDVPGYLRRYDVGYVVITAGGYNVKSMAALSRELTPVYTSASPPGSIQIFRVAAR